MRPHPPKGRLRIPLSCRPIFAASFSRRTLRAAFLPDSAPVFFAMKRSYAIALAGVMTALSVIFLMLAVYFPTGNLACYALTSVCLIPALSMRSRWSALLTYAATALLGLFTGQIAAVLAYVLCFGLYPFVVKLTEKWPPLLSFAVKLIYFNGMIVLCYYAAAELLTEALLALPLWALCLAGSAVFAVFDFLFLRIMQKAPAFLERFLKK